MRSKWYNNPLVLMIALVVLAWWFAALIWPVVGVVYFIFPRKWPLLRIILQIVLISQIVVLLTHLL